MSLSQLNLFENLPEQLSPQEGLLSPQPRYGPTLPESDEIHRIKYRLEGENFSEAMTRVAGALADNQKHFKEFREILLDMRFLPAGRIQAAAGNPRKVTFMNCFVIDKIEDTLCGRNGIMDRAKEAAQTMRMGGGVGYNFGSLRPRGDLIKKLESKSSGPVSFMSIFDSVCKTIMSAGHRRGAQMAVMPITHPDIEEFVHAKQNTDKLTGFNISVAVTDKFMEHLATGKSFPLTFKGRTYKEVDPNLLWEQIVRNTWEAAEPGILFFDRINEMNNLYYVEPKLYATNPCISGDTLLLTKQGYIPIEKTVGQKVEIWNGEEWSTVVPFSTGINDTLEITFENNISLRCTPYHEFILYDSSICEAQDLVAGIILKEFIVPDTDGENGGVTEKFRKVQFVVKRIDEKNPCETFCVTDPKKNRMTVNGLVTGNCAEQPLPGNGCCLLGSFNLTKYIRKDLDQSFDFDWQQFIKDIPIVIRAMDNVTDKTIYPLEEQEDQQKSKRRMGIGITGLANALEVLGYPYASIGFIGLQDQILKTLTYNCYIASAHLAKEKGSFPLYNEEKYLAGKFIQTLPEYVRDEIKKHGIRNSHLTSIAPTGTISFTADNISSGIEPVFAYEIDRTVQEFDGPRQVKIQDYGYRVWGVKGVTANECSALAHLNVLLKSQQYIDSSVSKTCNVPFDMPWAAFKDLYRRAWEGGAKGLSTFTNGGKRLGILKDSNGKDKSTGALDTSGEACYIDSSTGQKSCG